MQADAASLKVPEAGCVARVVRRRTLQLLARGARLGLLRAPNAPVLVLVACTAGLSEGAPNRSCQNSQKHACTVPGCASVVLHGYMHTNFTCTPADTCCLASWSCSNRHLGQL